MSDPLVKQILEAADAEAANDFRELVGQVQTAAAANRLWKRLPAPDRVRLGGSLTPLFNKYGTVGIWRRLTGASAHKSVLDISKRIDLITLETYDYLVREIDQRGFDDVDDVLQNVSKQHDLVLLEHPHRLYWKSQRVTLNWSETPKRWLFIMQLAVKAKQRQLVESADLGRASLKDIKSRLGNADGFPLALHDLIISAEYPQTYKLNLSPGQIRLYRLGHDGSLEEFG